MGESSISRETNFLPENQPEDKEMKSMKRTTAVFAVLLLSSLFAAGQNPPQDAQTGPEQRTLTTSPAIGNYGPRPKPGPTVWSEIHRHGPRSMDARGFFLVSHTKGTSSMGNWTGLAIYGYDPEKKVYTYDEFNSNGELVHATGTFDGKVWTWSADSTMGGSR